MVCRFNCQPINCMNYALCGSTIDTVKEGYYLHGCCRTCAEAFGGEDGDGKWVLDIQEGESECCVCLEIK